MVDYGGNLKLEIASRLGAFGQIVKKRETNLVLAGFNTTIEKIFVGEGGIWLLTDVHIKNAAVRSWYRVHKWEAAE